jgi:hypothetical protein
MEHILVTSTLLLASLAIYAWKAKRPESRAIKVKRRRY